MNDKVKRYLCIAGCIIVVVALVAVGWLLCRGTTSVPDTGVTATDVSDGLDRVAGEQRKAADALKRADGQLDDGLRTVGGLEQSNSDARQSADAISRANSDVKSAISGAQADNRDSASILDDSERRIRECIEIVQSVSKATGKD